jgi:hypothetical protein
MAFAALSVAACTAARPIPPQMGVQFSDNPGDWVTGYGHCDRTLCFVQLIPKGETMGAWKQSVVIQTIYADAPVRAVVDQWEAIYRKDDPAATTQETALEDGSIVVESRSDKLDEIGIRKFLKGPDGVYTVAYLARPQHDDEEKMADWKIQIRAARLIPRATPKP